MCDLMLEVPYHRIASQNGSVWRQATLPNLNLHREEGQQQQAVPTVENTRQLCMHCQLMGFYTRALQLT